jgi:F0F1-type ATP synthase assembly protein I
MKLLRPSTNVRSDDALGRGMDIAIMLGLFFGAGWLLDAWLGTRPLFMIVLPVLTAIGLFAKLKYSYDAAMDRLEAQRTSSARGASGTDRKPS